MQILNHILSMKTHVADWNNSKTQRLCCNDSSLKCNPGFMRSNDDCIHIFQYSVKVLSVILTGYRYSVVVGTEYQKYRCLSYLFLTPAVFRHLFTMLRILYRDNRHKL